MGTSASRTSSLHIIQAAALFGFACCKECAARWDVAYIARFYYPPGGKRISHQQVYLSDIHGRHRKQLTFGADEPRSICWVGRDHLVWTRTKGGRAFIDMIDLRTWKTRTVGGLRQLEACEGIGSFYASPKGSPSAIGDILVARPIYLIDGTLKELTPGGFRRISKERLLRNRQEATDAGESWRIPGQPSITLTGQDDHEFTTRYPDGSIETLGGRTTLTRDGKEYAFEFPGVAQYGLPGRDQDHAWIMSGSYSASGGSYEFLFHVDWQSGKARRVAAGVLDIDFDTRGRYFAALEGGRPLSAYGSRRRVWTCSVYAGELATGRRWPIASRLVMGQSVALRPLR